MFKPSVFNISVGDNVIYNSYSGAILKLSQPIADCISSCDNIDLLLEQGFIVDEKVNDGTIISSPGSNSIKMDAISNAVVPDVVSNMF